MNTIVVRLEAIIELNDLIIVCVLSGAIAFLWDHKNNDDQFWCKNKSAFNTIFSQNGKEKSQVVRKTETAPKQFSAVTPKKMLDKNIESRKNSKADQYFDVFDNNKSKVAVGSWK